MIIPSDSRLIDNMYRVVKGRTEHDEDIWIGNGALGQSYK